MPSAPPDSISKQLLAFLEVSPPPQQAFPAELVS